MFYSLLRQEANGTKMLAMAAELTRRGEEVLIVPTKSGYALCVTEPVAVPVANSQVAEPT